MIEKDDWNEIEASLNISNAEALSIFQEYLAVRKICSDGILLILNENYKNALVNWCELMV